MTIVRRPTLRFRSQIAFRPPRQDGPLPDGFSYTLAGSAFAFNRMQHDAPLARGMVYIYIYIFPAAGGAMLSE